MLPKDRFSVLRFKDTMDIIEFVDSDEEYLKLIDDYRKCKIYPMSNICVVECIRLNDDINNQSIEVYGTDTGAIREIVTNKLPDLKGTNILSVFDDGYGLSLSEVKVLSMRIKSRFGDKGRIFIRNI